MERENRRIYVTKKLMREGLLRLLKTQHIDKISVKRLCEEANVNRSTFYRYYTLPKDILLELETEILAQFRIAKPFENYEDIQAYLARGIRYMYENADTMRILLRNTSTDDYTLLMQNFARGMLEVSNIGGISPQKLRLLVAYAGAGSFYTLRQWLEDEDPLRPEELIDFTMELTERCMKIIS